MKLFDLLTCVLFQWIFLHFSIGIVMGRALSDEAFAKIRDVC